MNHKNWILIISLFLLFSLVIFFLEYDKDDKNIIKSKDNKYYKILDIERHDNRIITIFCENITKNVLVEFSNKNNSLENNIFYMKEDGKNVKCNKIGFI